MFVYEHAFKQNSSLVHLDKAINESLMSLKLSLR